MEFPLSEVDFVFSNSLLDALLLVNFNYFKCKVLSHLSM